MDSDITRAEIDKLRQKLKEGKPYTDEEIFSGIEHMDFYRFIATAAKDVLTYYGLSLTDENDYGDIKE